jgi:mono/diheme cytochrome c family protein
MKKRILFGTAMLAAGFVMATRAAGWQLPVGEPQLKAGPGVEVVTGNCLICHSADYISTQPRMNRAAWMATVQKMREKYGAPLPPDQVEKVVDYLAATYGRSK